MGASTERTGHLQVYSLIVHRPFLIPSPELGVQCSPGSSNYSDLGPKQAGVSVGFYRNRETVRLHDGETVPGSNIGDNIGHALHNRRVVCVVQ